MTLREYLDAVLASAKAGDNLDAELVDPKTNRTVMSFSILRLPVKEKVVCIELSTKVGE